MTFVTRRWVLPFASVATGLGMAQGLEPQGLWGLTLVGLVLSGSLFLATESTDRRRWRRAARVGWCLGFGYFLWGLRWIVEPFQVDAATYGWMAPFALVFMSAGLALFWGVAFGVARAVAPIAGVWALAGCWSLAELARAYVLTGFPWAGLGQAVPLQLFGGLLPWIGAHGLAFAIMAACLPLAVLLRGESLSKLYNALPALLLAGGVTASQNLPPPDEVVLRDETVRLVQPNAPQAEKWHPQKRWVFFDRAVALTAQPDPVDLTVWPETAVPSLLKYADGFVPPMIKAAAGAPILYGIQREAEGAYYNSAVLMGADGASLDIYDKVHLVPFGEYMPLSDLAARFGVFGLAARANAGYAPGAQRRLLDLPVGRALVLICYEGVFGQDIRAVPERADLMVLITNDAWFGDFAGPQQHLRQAQMRAAEQGLPMVRVANTGISALIDPWGRLRESLPLGVAGHIDAQLPEPLPPTLYSRLGDWPVLGLSLLWFCVGAGWSVRRHGKRARVTVG